MILQKGPFFFSVTLLSVLIIEVYKTQHRNLINKQTNIQKGQPLGSR